MAFVLLQLCRKEDNHLFGQTLFQRNLMRRVRILLIVALMFAGYSATPVVSAEGFTNFLGMEFLTIPTGSFKMGAVSGKIDAMDDELPRHTVAIPSFQIMTTEMTLAQFKRYIVDSSQLEIVTEEFMNANAFDDNAPVVFLSWNDINVFLHWLNQHKPVKDVGKYMLPSEAEWEYACRAGKNERYCGSDSARLVAWYATNSIAYQQPVAQKNANAFGLYDMSGNVRERVEDCYHENYANAPPDGSAWVAGCESFTHRVARGGSWDEGLKEARAADRLAVKTTSRTATVGFRVVRKVP